MLTGACAKAVGRTRWSCSGAGFAWGTWMWRMLRATLAAFNHWPKGNDPYEEHDFGAFDLFGERLFFKIDYYHPDHDTLAPVPSSIELCRRVLTIMLADEY